MIYAIEAVGSECVKIGYCTDLVRLIYRWKQLDTHNSHALTLLGVVWGGSRQQEKTLHVEWAPHQVKGEWFRLAPIRSDIKRRFERVDINESFFEIAHLLKTQREGKLPLLLDDTNFVSLEEEHSLSYGPGQEIWASAKEEAEITHRAVRRTRKGHDLAEIFRLRSEGHTFEQIGRRLGKDLHAVHKAFSRAQKRLNKQAA